MMLEIDPKNGILLLPSSFIKRITSSTDLEEVERSFWNWEKSTKPDGRSSITIELESHTKYETLHLLLWFFKSKMISVKIFISADSIGDASSRWSKAREIRRKKLHESRYRSALGKHDWGTVKSVYNVEEKQSYVLLEYTK